MDQGTTAWKQWMYPAMLVGVVAAVLVAIRLPRTDVDFCRSVFKSLATGNVGIQQRIAWDRFQALDVDVAGTYNALADDKEKTEYRAAFIQSFARGFQHVGAAPKAFVNWRVYARTPTQVVVAADYPAKDKTLLLAVPNTGKRQLEGLQWAAIKAGK